MQCFVIGPIGDDKSDTRMNADQVFEFVIKPVLTGMHFDVVRADRISTVASITDEIVKLIQISELYIIDLSEANPNVFYEAGRRHETGKPYIHLLREGQRAPFDVQGIRYVEYKDLSFAKNVFAAQEKLREFVDIIMKSGFGASTSVNPFTNIEESLRRLELRFAGLDMPSQNISKEGALSRSQSDDEDAPFDPRSRLMKHLDRKNYRLAEQALIDLDEIYMDKSLVMIYAGILASVGRNSAAQIIIKYLSDDRFLFKLKGDAIADGVLSLQTYYQITGQAEAGKSHIYELVDKIRASSIFSAFSDEDKATTANAAQKIAYYLDDNETALKYANIALQFAPNNPIYHSNLTLVYIDLKDFIRAEKAYLANVELHRAEGKEIPVRTFQSGARIYHALGQVERVEQLLTQMDCLYPEHALEVRRSILGT